MANQEITNASGTVPSPSPVTDAEKESIFKLLTTKNREARFNQMILRPDEAKFRRIASMMETDPDYFLTIIGTKNGSMRVQKLFGLSSHEANCHFCKAIVSRFVEIMKDLHACPVAVQAMMAFGQDQQKILLNLTLFHLVDLAKHKYGSVVINIIMTESNYLEKKIQIMDNVAIYAHVLSSYSYGATVVANVLKVNTFHEPSKRLALFCLRGRCVELSFTEPGRNVVSLLLDGTAATVNYVVEELRYCRDNNRLVRLAKDEFGNHVVLKALQVTARRADSSHLFKPLVLKLKTIRHLLGNSRRGNTIGEILDGTATFLP